MIRTRRPLRFLVALLAAGSVCLTVDVRASGRNSNNYLSCDAGGPYVVQFSNDAVSVQLIGSDSSNATSYVWKCSYPGALLSDPTAQNPLLTFVPSAVGADKCTISLTIKNGDSTKTCCTWVKLKDTTAPVIVCAETTEVVCGADTSPENVGMPEVNDDCDSHPKLTYHDKLVWPTNQAERFDHQIVRTWKAVDAACNVAKCVQYIDVLKAQTDVDVLPATASSIQRSISSTAKSRAL